MSGSVTGLVFDLPFAPWWSDVLALRAAHCPAHLKFPIEITVVGSSGLGWFSPGQPDDMLAAAVARVAKQMAPLEFRFSRVERFEGSNVYYLAVEDEAPFHAFQRALGECGLAYEPTPFSYKPHCTIGILPDGAPEEAHRAMQACPVPGEAIRINALSFYRVDHAAGEARQMTSIALSRHAAP